MCVGVFRSKSDQELRAAWGVFAPGPWHEASLSVRGFNGVLALLFDQPPTTTEAEIKAIVPGLPLAGPDAPVRFDHFCAFVKQVAAQKPTSPSQGALERPKLA